VILVAFWVAMPARRKDKSSWAEQIIVEGTQPVIKKSTLETERITRQRLEGFAIQGEVP